MRKILFTTVYTSNAPDIIKQDSRMKFFRFSWQLEYSMALRFIKKNIPEIEILEYPTWKQFKKKIETGNYDTVGFSFFLPDVPRIIRMINFARTAGVEKIWGGNYGVLTPGIEKYFDKVFIGYAERDIARELGKKIDRIKHPTALVYLGLPFGLKLVKQGVLHTIRGCTFNCRFCQAPIFSSGLETIPLESIENAIIKYKRMNVEVLLIYDENFGLLKKHADGVASLLGKYKMPWYMMARSDILSKNLDKWAANGLSGTIIAVDSLTQKNLDLLNKNVPAQTTVDTIKRINDKGLSTMFTYMIGINPYESKETILKNMNQLGKFHALLYWINYLTPLPRTPVWDDIENNFGFITKNYALFNTRRLVWNHPHIKPQEADEFRLKCYKTLDSAKNFFINFGKGLARVIKRESLPHFIAHIPKTIGDSNISYYIKREHKTKI